ncbi:MAG: hypothetical protein U0354_04560 [Candidatus Sericytochromatia bacterium]
MKKKLSALSLALSLVLLSACSNEQNLTQVQDFSSQTTQIQSAKKIKLNFNKTDKNAIISGKSTSKLTGKKSRGETKKIEEMSITFLAPSNKNDIDSKSAAAIARMTLNSMNSSQTYESGYKIARSALDRLASENVYIAKMAIQMANVGMYWETDFKIASAALNILSNETPVNVSVTCDMITSIMNSSKSYEEGSKIAYAALEIIGKTDNENVRFVVDTAVESAKKGMYWEDVFKTLSNTFSELRNF